MRYSWVCATAALSLLVIHCAASSENKLGSSDAVTDQDAAAPPQPGANNGTNNGTNAPVDAGPPPKPDPILDFSYDPQAKKLHALVLTTSATGAKLKVNIIPVDDGTEDATIDCDSATDAALANGVVAGKYTSFTLDDVSTKTLTNRLDGNTRTAIQGCLSNATGASIVQMQTSLLNAWDNDPTTKAASPRIYHGVEAYTNDCMADLGDLPMFANDADFNCMDPSMHVVPITATSSTGTVTTLDETTTHWPLTTAETSATKRCDRPAWLGYDGTTGATQCAPFSRIGEWQNSQGTRFAMVCRRYATRALSDPKFDDINFIAHNPNTGKTCFFNSHLGGTEDGTKIPAPDTSTSDKFWLDPAGVRDASCAQCHDSGPFMHSPWVDQVVDPATNHTLVPRITEDPAYTAQTKYSIFGVESFGTDAASQQIWHQPQHLTDVGSCGSCHRIGTQMTAQLWAARAVGDDTTNHSFMTSAFLTKAKLQWMPADPTSAQKIEACGQDPTSCTTEDDPH
jgi:hypothetical protein